MILVDIACPDCGAVEAVEKRTLDTYHCTACGCTFSAADYRADVGSH